MNIVELATQFMNENEQLIADAQEGDDAAERYEVLADAAVANWIRSGVDLSDYEGVEEEHLMEKVRSDFDYLIDRV